MTIISCIQDDLKVQIFDFSFGKGYNRRLPNIIEIGV